MIASWMIYATIVSSVLAAAAALLDRAGEALLGQRRWIWIMAIALSVGIPFRTMLAPRATAGIASADARAASGAPARLAANIGASDLLRDLLARAEPASLGRLDRVLAVAWIASGLFALIVYAFGTWSIARRRRLWREESIDGQVVLMAPATGPAVVGALKPAIVVPEWAIGLPADQRALMLEHERQHVAARDPLVLHTAALAVVAMPWNLATWWIVRRLRLAIEMDCDARVLATGRDARVYGNLLLDVCARRVRAGAMLSPALFERTSSLTRRILAMHPSRSRFAAARRALGAAVAAALTLVACDVPSPLAIVANTNVEAGKRFATGLNQAAATGSDAVRTTVARYFPAIAQGKGGPSILFVTKSAAGEVVRTDVEPARNAVGAKRPGPSVLSALRPDDIAAVEISKHRAGTVAPNAVSLITVTLKPGAVVAPAEQRER